MTTRTTTIFVLLMILGAIAAEMPFPRYRGVRSELGSDSKLDASCQRNRKICSAVRPDVVPAGSEDCCQIACHMRE